MTIDSVDTPSSEVHEIQGCVSCGRPLNPGAAFCGGCGHRRNVPRPDRGELHMVITFFVSSLVVMASWMIYARITENALATDVGATGMFTFVILGFVIRYRELIAEPALTAGFSIVGYVVILIASVPIVAVVAGYVHALNTFFAVHLPGDLAAYDGRSVLWPIVLVVIVPPLEEEFAFRGLIYGGLRRSMTVTETFLVSSFAFAILHLSVPSLVTHFPLGLYLCWLRHRSGSLWPGVFAHVCHNLGVCVLAWM